MSEWQEKLWMCVFCPKLLGSLRGLDNKDGLLCRQDSLSKTGQRLDPGHTEILQLHLSGLFVIPIDMFLSWTNEHQSSGLWVPVISQSQMSQFTKTSSHSREMLMADSTLCSVWYRGFWGLQTPPRGLLADAALIGQTWTLFLVCMSRLKAPNGMMQPQVLMHCQS